MEKYKNSTLQDLVWNDLFREWVLSPTIETNAQWHQWLSENPEKWDIVNEASEIVRAIKVKEPSINDQEIRKLVQQTIQKVKKEEKLSEKDKDTEGVHELEIVKYKAVFYRQTWFKIAASIALVVSLGFGAWVVQKNNRLGNVYESLVSGTNTPLIETINKTDAPQIVTLRDGSVVTLKKGSRISYEPSFNGDNRVVYLSGEAFFEVAKNPKKPFFVYANELVTKVLGTSFTIRAYKEDKEVTVEVKTGRVSVFSKKNQEQAAEINNGTLTGLVLTPNQKIVFKRDIEQLIKTLVAEPAIVVPKNDTKPVNFDFDDTPASEAFKVIKEAYSINIVYDEGILKHCPVTAPLTDQTLYDKLNIICKAIGARYEVLDGQIIIQSKGCK